MKKIFVFLIIFITYENYCLSEINQKKMLEDANQQYYSGNYSIAIEQYKNLLSYRWRKKDIIKIYTQLGKCYNATSQYDRSILSYQEALNISKKKYPEIYFDLGLIYEKINLLNEAIKCFEIALKSKKTSKFEVYTALGRVYYKLGLNSKALKYFKEALNINQDPQIYRYLSKCYEKLHNWELAISMIKTAITLENKTEDIIQLAFLYSIQNKYDDSINILKEVINRNPDNKKAMLHLAAAYFKINNITMAENIIKELRFKYPEDGLSCFLLGILNFFKGDNKEAKKELQNSIHFAKSPLLREYAEYLKNFIDKNK